MKEMYPVVVPNDMVNPILNGQKTTMRFVVRWPLFSKSDGYKRRIYIRKEVDHVNELLKKKTRNPMENISTPFRKGRRLYVKEAWHMCGADNPDGSPHTEFVYRADSETCKFCGKPVKWKSAIFMPSFIARIILQVERVWIERLQDITKNGVLKEGFGKDLVRKYAGNSHNYRLAFSRFWDSLHARKGYSWKKNPHVWVVKFFHLSRGKI